MRTLVKALVVLGLVLPLGAYVVGSLAAVGSDDPRPPDTIVIRDSPTRSATPHGHPSPSGRPTEDTHGPEVVTPSVHDLGDDHGGRRGGGDTSGGHGSGHGGGHGSDDSGGGGHG